MKARAIFISDTHLGFRGSQAADLLAFLETLDVEYLYLVGDIIDLWAMARSPAWKHKHTKVVNRVIAIARSGTKVFYLPGNHDEALRDYLPMVFEKVNLQEEAVHTTADGRRLLVVHGDRFDKVVQQSAFLAHIGSALYDMLIWANGHLNALRRALKRTPWSFAAYIKRRVKNAVMYVSSFEEAAMRHAQEEGYDGIICGHIHQASVIEDDAVLYANCGDWVESCTALIEDDDGRIRVINYS